MSQSYPYYSVNGSDVHSTTVADRFLDTTTSAGAHSAPYTKSFFFYLRLVGIYPTHPRQGTKTSKLGLAYRVFVWLCLATLFVFDLLSWVCWPNHPHLKDALSYGYDLRESSQSPCLNRCIPLPPTADDFIREVRKFNIAKNTVQHFTFMLQHFYPIASWVILYLYFRGPHFYKLCDDTSRTHSNQVEKLAQRWGRTFFWSAITTLLVFMGVHFIDFWSNKDEYKGNYLIIIAVLSIGYAQVVIYALPATVLFVSSMIILNIKDVKKTIDSDGRQVEDDNGIAEMWTKILASVGDANRAFHSMVYEVTAFGVTVLLLQTFLAMTYSFDFMSLPSMSLTILQALWVCVAVDSMANVHTSLNTVAETFREWRQGGYHLKSIDPEEQEGRYYGPAEMDAFYEYAVESERIGFRIFGELYVTHRTAKWLWHVIWFTVFLHLLFAYALARCQGRTPFDSRMPGFKCPTSITLLGQVLCEQHAGNYS